MCELCQTVGMLADSSPRQNKKLTQNQAEAARSVIQETILSLEDGSRQVLSGLRCLALIWKTLSKRPRPRDQSPFKCTLKNQPGVMGLLSVSGSFSFCLCVSFGDAHPTEDLF